MSKIAWFIWYGTRNAFYLWNTCGIRLLDAIHIEWMVAMIDVDEYFKEQP